MVGRPQSGGPAISPRADRKNYGLIVYAGQITIVDLDAPGVRSPDDNHGTPVLRPYVEVEDVLQTGLAAEDQAAAAATFRIARTVGETDPRLAGVERPTENAIDTATGTVTDTLDSAAPTVQALLDDVPPRNGETDAATAQPAPADEPLPPAPAPPLAPALATVTTVARLT